MKPSEEIRADGVQISTETAALLDAGWEDYIPGVDDVGVIEIGDDYIDAGGWDLILAATGALVTSVEQLEQYLRVQGIGVTTIEQFKRLDIYRTHVNQPGFEWMKAL